MVNEIKGVTAPSLISMDLVASSRSTNAKGPVAADRAFLCLYFYYSRLSEILGHRARIWKRFARRIGPVPILERHEDQNRDKLSRFGCASTPAYGSKARSFGPVSYGTAEAVP